MVAVAMQGQVKGLSLLLLLCRGRGRDRWRHWLAWMCWHGHAGMVVVVLLLGHPGGHGDGWVVNAGHGYCIAHACYRCWYGGGGGNRHRHCRDSGRGHGCGHGGGHGWSW